MKKYKALVARVAHEAARALVSGETAVWQQRWPPLWPWPGPPPRRGAAPGAGGGQGGLACCGPWGRREADVAERRSTAASGPQSPPAPWARLEKGGTTLRSRGSHPDAPRHHLGAAGVPGDEAQRPVIVAVVCVGPRPREQLVRLTLWPLLTLFHANVLLKILVEVQ